MSHQSKLSIRNSKANENILHLNYFRFTERLIGVILDILNGKLELSHCSKINNAQDDDDDDGEIKKNFMVVKAEKDIFRMRFFILNGKVF